MNTFEARAQRLANSYLEALRLADLTEMLSLFTDDALVHSPLYGIQPAPAFYRQLFADTHTSIVSLLDVLVHAGRRSLAIRFTYRWQLASGEWVQFEVIDWVQLAETDQIQELRILYDTAQSRQAWSEQQRT